MTSTDARCIVSLQVGRVQPLQAGDRRVVSGIVKSSVAERVTVKPLGLAGDEQADLTVHGGLAKAVYAYPVEHYEFWRERYRRWSGGGDLHFGALGENLTTEGVLEADLHVGDELRFPDCVLRVTQPRHPCFKFNAVMRSPEAAVTMLRHRLPGFYLAVETPGSLAAGDAFELVPGPRHTPLMDLFKSGPRSAA